MFHLWRNVNANVSRLQDLCLLTGHLVDFEEDKIPSTRYEAPRNVRAPISQGHRPQAPPFTAIMRGIMQIALPCQNVIGIVSPSGDKDLGIRFGIKRLGSDWSRTLEMRHHRLPQSNLVEEILMLMKELQRLRVRGRPCSKVWNTLCRDLDVVIHSLRLWWTWTVMYDRFQLITNPNDPKGIRIYGRFA